MTRVLYIKPLSATDTQATAFNKRFSVGTVFEARKMPNKLPADVYQYTLVALSQKDIINLTDREYRENFKELKNE